MPKTRNHDSGAATPPVVRLRGERGVAMVEMALVFVLFVMMVWGVITFGVAYQLRENMTHAAQEALRAAVVSPDEATMNSNAVARARSLMTADLGSSRADAPASPLATCSTNEASGNGYLDICTNYTGTAASGSRYPQCNDPLGGECMTVTIAYHWGDSPLVAPIPGIFAFMPTTLTVTATGRV